MPRRGISIDTGSYLAPYLINTVAEALIPKEVQKQNQRQLMLEAYSKLQPGFAKMQPEQRERAEDQFFQAFGMYYPKSPIRRLFGAGPEPITELPKNWEKREHPGIAFGLFPKTEYIHKRLGPMQFKPSPILSPEEQAELERLGIDPQEYVLSKTSIFARPSEATSIIRKVEEAKRKGEPVPLEDQIRYDQIMAEHNAKMEEYKSKKTAREEKTALEKQRLDATMTRFNENLKFLREKLASIERRGREMLRASKGDRRVRDAITYYKNRIDAVLRHNKQQLDMATSGVYGETFIPQFYSADDIDLLDFNLLYDSIMNPEPAPAEGGKGVGEAGVTPPPAPRGGTPSPKGQPKSNLDKAYDILGW